MPFKNKAQMRACFAQNNPKWDCHKWAKETPNLKSLPERKHGGMLDYSRKNCMKCGGKKKYQQGGEFPKEQDYPDYESWQEAVDNFLANVGAQQTTLPKINLPKQQDISQADFLPEEAISASTTPPNYDVIEPKNVSQLDAEANQLYASGSKQYQQNYDRSLGMGVLARGSASEKADYRSFYRDKYGTGINPVDPFKIALGVQSAETGLSWLSGVMDRKRQNRYLYNNLSTLGRIESQPSSNFQPNPYNLYAKLGGNIKRYMFTNDSENPAFPVDAGKMQQGGINMKRNPFSGSSKYAGGGLSREKNYGSEKKPYPSVASSDFAGGHRSYPIPTRADAIDALRLAHLHGRQDVIAKIHAKYPELRGGGMMSKMRKKHMRDMDRDMDSMMDRDMDGMKKGGKWIQKAINPAHKGWCTPLSNPHCTGHRRAFALMMKRKHGFQ